MATYFLLTAVAGMALAVPALQAQAQDALPHHVDYISRMGWGNNIITFEAYTAGDSEGNQYVAGTTQRDDLPTTDEVIQPRHVGEECHTASSCRDAFVAKLDPDGRLLWVTYLGGTGEESPTALAVDADGNVYLAGLIAYLPGQIPPGGFPYTSMQLPPAEPGGDGFLVKLTPDGETILYAVPLPGRPRAIALDDSGAIHLAGRAHTQSLNTQPDLPRGNDGDHLWIAKVNPSATQLEYSLLLGGDEPEEAVGIAADSSGVYVCGHTTSPDFPVTPRAFQADYKGGAGLGDAFALKVNAAGTALVYSTYLGGAEPDIAHGCAVGSDGSLFIAGATWGESFPATPGVFQPRFQGGEDPELQGADGFVVKLNPSGDSLAYSTYLGGASGDIAYSVFVDADGRAYVVGTTGSLDFPVAGPAQSVNRGFGDAFVTVLNETGSEVLFSTYLGSAGTDDATSISVSSSGEIFAGGHTMADFFFTNFPGTPGAFERAGPGYWAAKFSPGGAEQPLVYLDGIVNAASFLQAASLSAEGEAVPGAVSPGELVTLFGQAIGPESPLGLQLDANGRVATTVGEVRVLFDGVPAPLVYVTANQVNAVVPWSVAGKLTVQVEIEHNGQRSAAIELPVLDATPALFTTSPWGMGQAAALNQDGSLNSRDNPAALGSIVVLYATGLGPLDGAVADGDVIPIGLPYPGLTLPISVQMNCMDAEVLYVGPAPGFVAGLVQINVRVPNELYNSDGAVVSLRAGDYASPNIAGIAILLTFE